MSKYQKLWEYISDKAPEILSFEEIEEMAAKLSMDVEGGRQYGFFAGPYMAEVGMFSKALGGSSVFDDEGNPIMNSEITKQVYNWFDRMLKVGSMPTPAATESSGDDCRWHLVPRYDGRVI